MQKKSIYKYASEAGLPAGLYLTLMSACMLLSIKVPALPVLILPLGIGFPILLWSLMKKISREEPAYNKFSSLWLGGIYTVIFGTMICMFLSALYIVLVEPSFVHLYVNNALIAVESSPLAGEYEASIEMMRKAIDAHVLPSGLEFLTTLAWFTCFCGSILSLFLALLMSRSGKKVTREFPA
ncbi:MAG: DUF4199 domain-containing protein [Muribaculaceae bacterium]|nr:DUF4199 domain-containing protein [Muribaculaceae bacterium]